MPVFRQDLRHVGQIIFAGFFVGLDLIQVLPQQLGAKAINPGVDSANLTLRRGRRFLFDDGRHRAALVEQHAPVSGRIGQLGRDQRRGSFALRLLVAQMSQRVTREQRCIAIQHHHQAGIF